MNSESIFKSIDRENISIVSFDIFDTLIFRPALFPQDIFYILSKFVEEQFSVTDFYHIRFKAENELRTYLNQSNTNYGEISIFDIYSFISEKYAIDAIVCSKICAEEIELEKKLTLVRPDVKKIYDHAVKSGKRIIAVSDMYLPSVEMRKILDSKGFKDISEIYVSSDCKCRKDSGALYLEVIREEKTDPEEIIHIGDNYNSDVEMAQKAGITAFHCQSLYDYVFSKGKVYSKIWDNISSLEVPARFLLGLSMYSWFMDREIKDDESPVFQKDLSLVGYLGLGPLLLNIVIKIITNDIISKEYSKIYFSSRDGFLPQKVYEIIGRVLACPGSEYLYCGRRAYNIYKYEDDPVEYILGNGNRDEYFTVRNLLESVFNGESNSLLNEILGTFSFEELNSDYRNYFDKLKSVLVEKHAALSLYFSGQKENAQKYYREKIIENPLGRAVIFDVGYGGSVSESIGALTGYIIDKLYLSSDEKNDERDDKNKTKTWILMNDNKEISEKHPGLFIFLEEMFSSTEPTCIGFNIDNDGSVRQILNDGETFSSQMCSDLKTVQDAVLKFVNLSVSVFGTLLKYLHVEKSKPLVEPLIFAFAKSRYNEELMFENIKFSDSFYSAYEISLSSKMLQKRIYLNLIASEQDKLSIIREKDALINTVNDKNIELACWGQQLDKEIEGLREAHRIKDTQIAQQDAQIAQKDAQIAQKDAQIAQKDAQIAQKDAQIAQKDAQIAQKDAQIAQKDAQIAQKDITLKNIYTSKKWKLIMALSRNTPRFVKSLVLFSFRFNPVIIIKRNRTKMQQKKKDCGIIKFLDASLFFDASWYLSQYPDVVSAKMNPYLHFYYYGGLEGRAPSPYFDSAWYLQTYPDVKTAKLNPLFHYIQYGKAEGRDCSPVDLGQKYNFEKNGEIAFPVFAEITVSIVIPVFNKWMYTRACLISVFKKTRNTAYEIIIGDDGSSDETVNLTSWFSNVTVVKTETNLGFLGNCNNAAKYARGKYVLFLNNDTSVYDDWLDQLVSIIEKSESIGLVGSKLLYSNGKLQEAGGVIWNDASGCNFGWGDDPEKPEYNYVKDVDYISGACIMIRKSLWDEIGGFDQRFAPAYYEDVDIAFEIRKRGYRTVYQPKSEVVHLEGISNGKDLNFGMKRYQIENKTKFYEKWKDELEKNHFENGVNVFQARDRSRYKKTILIIDHYVPEYDKDAGSRLLCLYMILLVDLGYNVKFISDNFAKSEPYSTFFLQKGIEILYGVLFENSWRNWILDNAGNIDFVLLNRPHISVKYIDFIRENTKAKLVYHGVDLGFVRELAQYEATGDECFLHFSNESKKIELALINKCDEVITVSEDEKNVIRKETGKNATVFPIYYWDNVPEIKIDFSKRSGLFFVGGFSHTPNVDAILWFINEIMPIIIKSIPDITLTIAGSNTPDEIKKLASERIFIKGFLSDDDLVEEYGKSRIFIIPLRYGGGVKGKTVDTMFQGVPIVSTKFGIEGLEGIHDVLTDFNDAAGFASEVVRLYNDEGFLEEKSSAERLYISKHFTREIAVSIMSAVFASGKH